MDHFRPSEMEAVDNQEGSISAASFVSQRGGVAGRKSALRKCVLSRLE